MHPPPRHEARSKLPRVLTCACCVCAIKADDRRRTDNCNNEHGQRHTSSWCAPPSPFPPANSTMMGTLLPLCFMIVVKLSVLPWLTLGLRPQNSRAGTAAWRWQSQQQNRTLKVLFLSSDTGGGHRASAEALGKQFQRHFPNSTYNLMDIWMDIDSSWPYNTIRDTYKSFSASPWKWATLYHIR